MSDFLVIIPARFGSKGIPYKNLLSINGKNLIEHAFHSAQKTNLNLEIVVSSDSEIILNKAEEIGSIVHRRPKELTNDSSETIDAVNSVLGDLRKSPKYVIVLQPTSPFRKMSTIIEASRLYDENNKKMVVSFTKTESKPFWSFIKNKENKMEALFPKKLNLRSQDLPNTYEVNGLAYLISPEDLMKQKTFFSKSIVPLVTLDKKEAVDIDYLEDFKEAESLLSKD